MMDLELKRGDFGGSLGAREIANSIEELIKSHRVAFNSKLPAIRDLARTLGVSPTTAASAYRELERRGVAKGQGRAGTLVARRSVGLGGARVFHMGPAESESAANDYSTGYPDPRVLLDYSRFAEVAASGASARTFLNRAVCEELAEPLKVLLGVGDDELTVVNGSLDALDRVLAQVCVPGDRVVVEEPNFPPIFDLLEVHRLIATPVRSDADGIVPQSLVQALQMRPRAMIMQPRAQNPTGVSMSGTRFDELAALLFDSDITTLIEDDHSGDVSMSPRRSLRGSIRADVVTIFGFSKSHGPDLRISAIAAPPQLISRIVARRRLGPSWTSEILQRILALTLKDPRAQDEVERARQIYSKRLMGLVDCLSETPSPVWSRDGLNAWVPVSSEIGAITDLARIGMVVAPGSAFHLVPPQQPHIRITTASLASEIEAMMPVLRRWL